MANVNDPNTAVVTTDDGQPIDPKVVDAFAQAGSDFDGSRGLLGFATRGEGASLGTISDLENRVQSNAPVVAAARQGADQSSRPTWASQHPKAAELLNGIAEGLRNYGEAKEDPRLALAQRGQYAQLVEALARLKEASAYHEGMLASRNYSTDVRSQYNQGRLGIGEENVDLKRRQMSQGITAALAKMGYKPTWSDTGGFEGIQKMSPDELSAQQTAGISLTNARATEATAHANYLDELPDLKQKLAQLSENTKLQIAQLAHGDRQLALALQSKKQEDQVPLQLFATQMHWLQREGELAAKYGYEDYGGKKENFDKFYQQSSQSAVEQLKSSVHGAGPASSPAPNLAGGKSYKQTQNYLGHTYGRNSNAEPWVLIK